GKVWLEQVTGCSLGPEGGGEVARPAADVEHRAPGQAGVALDLAHGVLRQPRVESLGFALLCDEQPEQPRRPGQAGALLAGTVRLVRAHAGSLCPAPAAG